MTDAALKHRQLGELLRADAEAGHPLPPDEEERILAQMDVWWRRMTEAEREVERVLSREALRTDDVDAETAAATSASGPPCP